MTALFVLLALVLVATPTSGSVVRSYNNDWAKQNTPGNGQRQFQIISSPRQLTAVSFSWTNCGSASDLATIYNLTIGPDPLPIPGNVYISAKSTLKAKVDSPLSLDLEIQKKEFLWVSIPCIDDLGSCSYDDICPLLEQVSCPPEFLKYGITCRCPFPAKNFDIPKTIIAFPSFGIPSWLDQGDYKIKATLKTGDQQVLCLQTAFSIN